MECVIITRRQNLALAGDMTMVKNDVRHVRSLFIMMDYFVHAVISDCVNPHDTSN